MALMVLREQLEYLALLATQDQQALQALRARLVLMYQSDHKERLDQLELRALRERLAQMVM
jgi:hypothetical protein